MKNISFDQALVKLFIRRYKDYIIPAVVIIVCLIVFIEIIPGQIQNVFTARQNSSELRKKIDVMAQNYKILTQTDDIALDTDFTLASEALPSEKDYEAVFTAISDTAAKAGVNVDDYGLDAGDTDDPSLAGKLLPMSISLSIHGGGIEGTKKFIAYLSKAFPLSEVSSVSVGHDSAGISVNFYLEPFRQIKTDGTTAIKILTAQQKAVLTTLSQWKSDITAIGIPASSGASIQ